MTDKTQKDDGIAVIGGGSMGTALAWLIAHGGRSVKVWTYEQPLSQQINAEHVNGMFLPGVELPRTLTATSSLEDALSGAKMVLSVTPSQRLREIWQKGREYLRADAVVVSASKGVETGSAMLMSQVLEEVLPEWGPDQFAYVSGPSFAKEIVTGQPTAVVVASANNSLAQDVQRIISTGAFRAYTTDDVVGVELGGALKNVIAIAVGVAEGMNLGTNSRAALITRGLAEVSRLAVVSGANPLTLAGLAGVGDLVLTCTGHLSRNLQVGIRLGKGETLDEILGSMKMVAEGVATAGSALDLARRHNVEMPISGMVAKLLAGDVAPSEAVKELMSRRLRSEREW